MFPLLCKLFARETKFQVLGSKFFLNPIHCIINELDDMQRQNKLNYATLVLCLLNKNSLSEHPLEDTENKHFMKMKSDTLKACKLESHTDTFKFMEALSAMEGTYTIQCGMQYTFIHDSMLEVCAYQYGKQFPDQILLYMNSSYIANYVKPEACESGINKVKEKQRCSQSSKGDESSDDNEEIEMENDDKNIERDDSFDLCIRLREDQCPLLAQRLFRDMQNMELYDVFRNQVLKHPQVCKAFICELETKSYTELKLLFLSSHEKVDKIVSEQQCVVRESNERREWNEERRQEVLVDQRKVRDKQWWWHTYMDNVRVISWVIYYGHHKILQYIVQQTQQNNAIREFFGMIKNTPNQSKSGISSSDYHGGEHNRHVDKSESWTSTCNKHEGEYNRQREEGRLLLLSCYSGDLDTFRVLLSLVSKEAISGSNALTAACEGGHVSMVKELVKMGADINVLGNYWTTPLLDAFKEGRTNVMEELAKAEADVNLQGNYQNTPLIAACIGGHVNVVKEVVKAGADVNLMDRFGNTPLIAACEGGHLRVVKKLMKAGADINLLNIDENTPLIAAVKERSLSTVKYLVEHGADLLTKVDFYQSAVYIALMLNTPDVVKYLLEEMNKISPGKFIGNVDLFNSLVDIRNVQVKIDSMDDVVVTNRSVWFTDTGEITEGVDLWSIFTQGDCDVLRHLLRVGLDANMLMQLYYKSICYETKPLLYMLIDDRFVRYKTEKVRTLLEAGANINVRVKYRKLNATLGTEAVSALERTRRLVCECEKSKNVLSLDRNTLPEYKRVMREIKKCVRRHSV
jgi:ankyrin repeat protein